MMKKGISKNNDAGKTMTIAKQIIPTKNIATPFMIASIIYQKTLLTAYSVPTQSQQE